MANSDGSVVLEVVGDDSKFKKTLNGLGSAAKSALGNLGSVAGAAMKGVAAGISAASSGVGLLAKQSLNAYSSYEQLVGGVETLFGSSSDVVMDYANNAFKTAGLSANGYMETVTSFAASLLQGLGGDTKAAADIANVAVTDMSDNANKMGTAMGSIQDAYQGFAKQNYTMLDNLKLGYGGTQAEMARLINDSGVLGDTMEVTAKTVNDVSFDKIIEAIHVVQTRLGITGTTAEEAATTIEGSMNAAKAAWENLLVGVADESADLDALIQNFVESAATAASNVVPRISQILYGLGEAIQRISPIIAAELPALITATVPAMVVAGANLLTGLVAGLLGAIPELAGAIPQVIDAVVRSLATSLPTVAESGAELIQTLVQGVSQGAPEFFTTAAEIISQFVQSICAAVPQVISIGVQIIGSLAQGLIQALPSVLQSASSIITSLAESFYSSASALISAGSQMIANLISGLVQALPDIVSAAVETVSQYVQAVLSNVPQLIEVGGQAIAALVEGLADSAGELADAAPEIITRLCDGLADALPDIVAAAVDIVASLVDTIAKNLPKIVKAGIQLLTNLVAGLVQAIPTLLAKIPQIIVGIVGVLANNAPKIIAAGVELIGQLAIGLISAIPQILAAIPQLIAAIIQGFASVDWLAVGRAIVDGIVQGIKNAWNSAVEAVKGLGKSLVSSAKSALGIKSPSKVFAKEVGAWLPPGIGEGVEQAMPELNDDMRRQLQDLVDDANLSVAAEVGNVSGQLALSAVGTGGSGDEPKTVTNENGVVVNVYYSGTSDPQDVKKISRQIGIETAKELRRRGGT